METVNVVKGFGRPFVFNSEVQKRVGRTSEAKESARVALKSPWWTLGCRYEEAAELAGWEDEQIEFIREKVSEEGKQDDLKKGKAPEQDLIDGVPLPKDVRGSPIVGSLLFESQGPRST